MVFAPPKRSKNRRSGKCQTRENLRHGHQPGSVHRVGGRVNEIVACGGFTELEPIKAELNECRRLARHSTSRVVL